MHNSALGPTYDRVEDAALLGSTPSNCIDHDLPAEYNHATIFSMCLLFLRCGLHLLRRFGCIRGFTVASRNCCLVTSNLSLASL